jgi:hypothetical protein
VREFIKSHLSDFTIKCFEQPIALRRNMAAQLPRSYIACTGDGYPARTAFAPFAQHARTEGWPYHELPTGHDCHAEMPEAFASLAIASLRTTI